MIAKYDSSKILGEATARNEMEEGRFYHRCGKKCYNYTYVTAQNHGGDPPRPASASPAIPDVGTDDGAAAEVSKLLPREECQTDHFEQIEQNPANLAESTAGAVPVAPVFCGEAEMHKRPPFGKGRESQQRQERQALQGQEVQRLEIKGLREAFFSGLYEELYEGLYGRGLLHYRKWWERSQADISVNGDLLSGVPIFTDENTLRVVNDDYSYFIPLEKVDYIRTTDGLKSGSRLGAVY